MKRLVHLAQLERHPRLLQVARFFYALIQNKARPLFSWTITAKLCIEFRSHQNSVFESLYHFFNSRPGALKHQFSVLIKFHHFFDISFSVFLLTGYSHNV
jgi:hypothetical protein